MRQFYRVSQKFVPLISCARSKLLIILLLHEISKRCLFALSRTCTQTSDNSLLIQMLSYQCASFVCLLITFRKDNASWSWIRHVACRAPDDPFWAVFFLYNLVCSSHFNPLTSITFFRLGSWKNIYILGIHPKKAFPQWDFWTSLQIWHQLHVAWRTEQSFFFAISGAFNLRFLWTCSRLSLLTVVRATSSSFLCCT